jgi:L-iditol 2-dehydrogenase
MTGKMLAAVYHGPQDLSIENVAVPQITPDEMLLKVESASICGTDLRIFHGNHRMYAPGTVRIPGHEVVGRLAAVGSNVTGFEQNDRVFIAPNMGCGHCRQCVSGNNNLCPNYAAIGVTMDGGFAQYMKIPAQAVRQGNVMKINAEVDAAVAALIEPFACVLRGQTTLNIKPGDIVLIMGAGPIGIMHLLLAKLSGASRVLVSEPMPARKDQALNFGAHRVIDPVNEDLEQILLAESNGQGADVIIVAAPVHQAQESAIKLVAISGRINFFGGLPKDKPVIQFDSNAVHYKELLITGTTACSTADCVRAAEIVNSGRIDLSGLVSKRFPLQEAVQAFAAAEDRNSLKVVIEP